MLTRFDIRTRLVATLAILGLLVAAAGALGVYGMQSVNAALEDTYRNQLASGLAIGASKNALSRARLVQDRAVLHPDSPQLAALLERADGFLAKSDETWKRYLSLPQDADEKALSDATAAARKAFVENGLGAMAQALRDQDAARIDRVAMKEIQPLFAAYSDASDKLEDYQMASAQRSFDASQQLYRRILMLSVAAAAGALLLAAAAGIALVRAIVRPLDDAVRHFDAMAAGDLSHPIGTGGTDEMGRLMRALARMQAQLAGTVRGVRDGSAAIVVASDEIAQGNLDLSRRTEQQAASLEETASSLEELTSTVRQNADNARLADDMVGSAAQLAQEGGRIVARVVDTMGEIAASSGKISEITATVEGIAFQTNILALNAAVEAARAGEQGRGFAVVASEVRTLAQRSALAARDIKALVGSAVASVDSGAVLAGQAGAAMDGIVTSVVNAAGTMNQIMLATTEQSTGIDLINQAIVQMDQVTQQNAALVEQAAAAAGALNEQAVTLERTVGMFRVDAGTAAPRQPAPAAPRALLAQPA
ncbi:HAMP domain-containing protein [Massilia forsythiae]|uniref:HAMP domain-containing protein n=1 Tax=Massilia forsythiae TaxID=2728020 RepID=A0A7Z2VU84_9BURK|nr:Tar ligand binding domain-containing protein [Massilia forsythiae]QJD99565.1 HAMP domain-containing protein [Massilia forsythiae]